MVEQRIFIVSFPKTGRTWMRVLLSRYVQTLLGIENFELKLHDRGSKKPYVTPKFIFTHARSDYLPGDYGRWQRFLARHGCLYGRIEYPFDFSMLRKGKVIFLMRDPRDTLVSYYHQLTRRQRKGKAKQQSMTGFIRNPLMGAQRLISFMNKVAREKKDYEHLFVYYENLKSDTAGELTSILQFAGIETRPDLVNESVDFAQFENMRKMELQGSHGEKLQPGNKKDPDSFKVRKGKVGSFRQELNEKEIRYLDTLIIGKLDGFYRHYKDMAR